MFVNSIPLGFVDILDLLAKSPFFLQHQLLITYPMAEMMLHMLRFVIKPEIIDGSSYLQIEEAAKQANAHDFIMSFEVSRT